MNAEKTTPEPLVSQPPAEARLFDLKRSVEYLKALGLDGATLNFVRTAVSSGAVPSLKCGRKLYVSRAAWEAYVIRHERRSR